MKNLCEAIPGDIIRIVKNNTNSSLKERLLALGMTEGADIEVLRKGPKNNLTVYRIRGAMIALRNEETQYIYCS
jgi:ferrous iron transport protein A